MAANTKVRSALRAALKQEDAALTERIPAEAAVEKTPVVEPAAGQAAPAPAKPVRQRKAIPSVASADAVAPVVTAKPAPARSRRTVPKPVAAATPLAPVPEVLPEVSVAPPVVVPAVPMPEKASKARKKAKAVEVEVSGESARRDKPEKVVRDSFSIPASEHRQIKLLREELGRAGCLVSKSEVLRAGLAVLCGLNRSQLKDVVQGLTPVTKGKRSKKR